MALEKDLLEECTKEHEFKKIGQNCDPFSSLGDLCDEPIIVNPVKKPTPAKKPDSKGVFCSACRMNNPKDAIFCEHCGKRLVEPPKPTPFMWKKWMTVASVSILIVLVVAVILLPVFRDMNSVYYNAESMADAAHACIEGWKDIDMLMPLTPYPEDSEIYNIASYHFQSLMDNTSYMSQAHTTYNDNLRKVDRSYYNQIQNDLKEYGIIGIKAIKRFYYQYDSEDRFVVFVAKIGSKWYTITVEFERADDTW